MHLRPAFHTLFTALLAVTLFIMQIPVHAQQFTPPETTSKEAPKILTGADQMDLYLPLLEGKRVAIFANQTAVVGSAHLVDTLLKKGVTITKIFSPEHGFRGNADAGEHVSSTTDPATGISIISLYGRKQAPSADDMADVDILLFDIQDVGVRFYTYISSMQEYLQAAILHHRPLILLDRPNPNGFYVDGPVLNKKFRSFVGMQPIPVVYGMTLGEYAKMLVGEQWLDSASNAGAGSLQLTIIPCRFYTHRTRYILPVKPSPNLPNARSIALYPSLCLFEGTPVSVGRGTSKPFQQFGHPSFPKNFYHFTPASGAGAKNPPLQNQVCYGYDLSRIDVEKETGNEFSLKWILEAYRMFPDKEHFFSSNGFFNKLAGNDILQQQIKDGLTEDQIRRTWQPALAAFRTIRKKYLIYAD